MISWGSPRGPPGGTWEGGGAGAVSGCLETMETPTLKEKVLVWSESSTPSPRAKGRLCRLRPRALWKIFLWAALSS